MQTESFMLHKIKIGQLAFIIFLLSGLTTVQAQQFGENVKQEGEVKLQQGQQGFKPDVRISLGTSFSTFGPGYNTFGTFISPEISFPVYKKFSVQVGLGYSSLFFSQPGENMFGDGPSQYGSFYVSGTYQVNEKLTIRGTGYKTFLLNPAPPGETVNPRAVDFSNQGVILDMNYKINEHFQINAGFEYRKQNYPAYYPYNSNGFNHYGGSPLINPAFGPGF